MVDVFLHYPARFNCKVLYRIHDPVPPADERLKIFHIRSAEKVQAGQNGWRLLFDVSIDEVRCRRGRGYKDVERDTWSLTAAHAERLRDTLFGTLADKVPTLQAVLFVLASVGFHMEMRDPEKKYSEDGFAYVEGPDWKIGKCGWIGTNLRAACGVPFPGEQAKTKVVVEDDSDYGRDDYDDDENDGYYDEDDEYPRGGLILPAH